MEYNLFYTNGTDHAERLTVLEDHCAPLLGYLTGGVEQAPVLEYNHGVVNADKIFVVSARNGHQLISLERLIDDGNLTNRQILADISFELVRTRFGLHGRSHATEERSYHGGRGRFPGSQRGSGRVVPAISEELREVLYTITESLETVVNRVDREGLAGIPWEKIRRQIDDL